MTRILSLPAGVDSRRVTPDSLRSSPQALAFTASLRQVRAPPRVDLLPTKRQADLMSQVSYFLPETKPLRESD